MNRTQLMAMAGHRVLLILLASWLPVAAQEIVGIQCLTFPLGKSETLELLTGPEKVVELSLESHVLSAPVKVPHMPVWSFGKSSKDAEGNFKFTSYAKVKSGPAAKQLLIFIHKGPEPEDGFMVVALDGTLKGFGDGEMFFCNLSRRQVAGQIGGRRFRLSPTKHTIIKPKADRGEGVCFAAMRYQDGDDWRSFFSTNWPLLQEARGLVFIYDDPRSKSLKVHSLVDSLFEPTKEDS